MTSPSHSPKLAENCRASSTSSSNNGNEETIVGGNSGELRLNDVLKQLSTQMIVLTHRIESISKVFNVPNCDCFTCNNVGKPNEKIQVAPELAKEPIVQAISNPTTPPATTPAPEAIPATVVPEFATIVVAPPPLLESQNMDTSSALGHLTPEMIDALIALQQQNQNAEAEIEDNNNLNNIEVPTKENGKKRGRKSKYFNTETKEIITNYARQHGPNATARKFKIPPPVASYYYRKASSSKSPKLPNLSGAQSPKNSQVQVVEEPQLQQQPAAATPSMMMPLLQTSTSTANTHLSGSPGFLRGRGRGRPKLIGDELDNALLDFMVEMKKASQNLTAGRAMDLAKDYIKKHSPGLLIEEGGSVNLKNTWAMKLLIRVAEREQELAATNSNEVFNPLTSLLGSFDGNTADFANMLNFVHQMSNSAELLNSLTKPSSSNSDSENAENEISKSAAAINSTAAAVDQQQQPVASEDALRSFLAAFQQQTQSST